MEYLYAVVMEKRSLATVGTVIFEYKMLRAFSSRAAAEWYAEKEAEKQAVNKRLAVRTHHKDNVDYREYLVWVDTTAVLSWYVTRLEYDINAI